MQLSNEHFRTYALPGQAQQYSVYSGRQLLGTVQQANGCFIATNLDGVILGRFPTPIQASRALPEGEPS